MPTLEDKMKVYNVLATPPNDAIREIKGGNLKGFSDINPQWRYEVLTDVFGMCGIEWKYTIDKWFTQEVSTGEIMIFVQVSLYVKQDDKWSDPIPAFGGDYLVKRDRNGIHGNDEAMKMAITDALGTASKMLGVAADVYRGIVAHGASDSKYARRGTEACQNAQNAAHGAQTTNKGNNTNPAWAAAVKALNAKMNQIGVSGSEVAAISGLKFGKVNTRDMSVEEVTALCSNLEKWIEEEGRPVEDKD